MHDPQPRWCRLQAAAQGGVVLVVGGQLVERVRQALAAHPPVREVTMFGGLSFMVRERMVVCVRGDGDLLVRADPARADELLALDGARPAEMGAGRPMGRSWISVGPAAVATDEGLAHWLGVALQHRDEVVPTPARGRRGSRSPGSRGSTAG